MTSPAGYLGRPAEVWAGMLDDADPLKRRLAAHALGEIGPAAEVVAAELRRALDDETPHVRVWAAAALARVEGREQDAVRALIAATAEDARFVRSLAAWHLGRLGVRHPAAEAAGPALEALLSDADPSVRTEAELALRRLRRGRPAEAAQGR